MLSTRALLLAVLAFLVAVLATSMVAAGGAFQPCPCDTEYATQQDVQDLTSRVDELLDLVGDFRACIVSQGTWNGTACTSASA